MVNAESIVGRVTIEGDTNLGVIYPGYTVGQPITVPRGESKYIQLYNGNPYGGPIQFTLTFSGAEKLLASTIASVTTMMMF